MTIDASDTPRSTRRLVWGLAAAIVVAAVAAALWQMRERPAGGSVLEVISLLTTVIMFAVFGVTGALILSHQPRHTVGRLMMLEGTLIFAWPIQAYYESVAVPPPQPSALLLLGR
jgi:riboflavin transporter FmnP